MASDPLTIKGLIIESREYKEKDRIVTILSGSHGILDFIAKGTAKPGSRMSSVSVPYMLCEFVLTDSHGFYYLKEVSIISSNSNIINSLEALSVAGHCAICLKSSVLQSDNARDAYELAVYTFYALSEYPARADFIYAAFNWKLLSILGLAADYTCCNGCGSELSIINSTGVYLSYNDNQCFCSNCGERYCGSNRSEFKLMSLTSANLLHKIITSEYGKIFLFNVKENIVKEVRLFTTEYLKRQLELEISDPLTKLERKLWN